MTTKLREWGNSYGLTVTRSAAKSLHLSPGDELSLQIKNGGYFFKPVAPTPKAPTLKELIASIPKGGVKLEFDDAEVGNEIVVWEE